MPVRTLYKPVLTIVLCVIFFGACTHGTVTLDPREIVQSEVVVNQLRAHKSGDLAIIWVGGHEALSRCSDFAYFIRRSSGLLPKGALVTLLTDDDVSATFQFRARGLSIPILTETRPFPNDRITAIAVRPTSLQVLSAHSLRTIDARAQPRRVADELDAWVHSLVRT